MAQHFIPNPENLPVVNHINSIRDDNRVENLEWVTVKQNMQHMVKAGRAGKRKLKGEEHPNTKLTNEDVLYIRSTYTKGRLNKEVFNMYKHLITRSAFDSICYGISWKHLL